MLDEKCEILPCINPATGRQFDEILGATPTEVRQALQEMREAAHIWGRKPVKERIQALKKLQETIVEHADYIAEVINQDHGKSRQDGLIEIFMAVDKLHQYCRRAPRWLRRERVPRGLYPFKRYYTEPRPFGVAAVIGPWNFPFDLTMTPLFSALLAGNTVVLKPSEVTPAVGALIEQLLQSVPALSPFVRVLHGGPMVGAALVEAGPDIIFLTGSTNTGRKVVRAAAKTMTPVICELGGKDPMIVLEDADIGEAARWGVWGTLYNAGQTCQRIERVYVVESVYDQFVEAAVNQIKQLKIGYSADLDTPYHMSSLTFDRQVNIIQDHLDDAVEKGARIILGGKCEQLFFEPTVVVDVDHSMQLMQDETFGPVMPIMKVKDEAEAIHLANDSYYGLSASVWSNDVARAERVAQQLEVGSVNVNDSVVHYAVPLLPFGGLKQSGNARTHCREEVLQFTQSHSYAVGGPPVPFDLPVILRAPGHYRLGKTLLQLVFGTPRQRMQPIREGLEQLKDQSPELGKPAKVATATAAAGLAAGLTMILFAILRGRKS